MHGGTQSLEEPNFHKRPRQVPALRNPVYHITQRTQQAVLQTLGISIPFPQIRRHQRFENVTSMKLWSMVGM